MKKIKKQPKYIFICGGVMSGVGKGTSSASIGKILQSRGFKVTAIKIDPYVNVDAGTMNPTEHGEVFVTEDGTECDQDVGNYERFLNTNIYDINYITTGRVYQTVIQKERNLEYGGKCVEVVPHIPEEVIRRIKKVAKSTGADFILIEIGGTVGEYQNILFLEAARILKIQEPKNVLFILVTYLPIPSKIGEMKTKPTQQAVRTMNSAGLQPDIIIARAEKPLDEKRKEKISMFCNVDKGDVISAPDVDSIYEIPLNFEKDNLSLKILKKFQMKPKKNRDLQDWEKLVKKIHHPKKEIKIGIAGKYFKTGDFILTDSYISVIEAVKHAAYNFDSKPIIDWLDTEEFEDTPSKLKNLKNFDGIIVPGGFGSRGTQGKIKIIKFCRENNIPFLGICYGMQIAVIEFARNVLNFKDANSTEINPKTKYPVIDLMEEQKKNLKNAQYGGTMRLGAYNCEIKKGTIAFQAYKNSSFPKIQLENGNIIIQERHRHRYEFNNKFKETFEKNGMIFSGINPETKLVEIIEIKNHPFFVGSQFHPEFKSRPLNPHPLFQEFIKSTLKNI